jgi:phosphoribosylaminoimidazolecarboxamide formyltransferase/IMP cyclohydrolase
LRVLELSNLSYGETSTAKVIAGGILVQTSDDDPVNLETWEVATTLKPTGIEMAELVFAWKVSRHVKSNAIVITSDRTTIGIGAGQMNRVGSAQIALNQAGIKTQGATLASDGFFPFDDSVKLAAAAGIKFIVQPGGSLRDQDSIKAANELGIIMVITHTRHFLH